MFHVNHEPKGKFLRTETISCIYKLHNWKPRSRSTAAGVVGNTAFVCLTACTDAGKRLHTLRLTHHWVYLRVLAEDRWQTAVGV